jgi:hypothetical protein
METGPALVAVDAAWLRYGLHALIGDDVVHFTRDDPANPLLSVHVVDATNPIGLIVTRLYYSGSMPPLRVCIPWSRVAGIGFVETIEEARECIGFCQLPLPSVPGRPAKPESR